MIADTALLSSLAALTASQSVDAMDVAADDEGWHLMCLDPSHTSMMKVDVKAGAFEGYEVMSDLVLSADRLATALKNMGQRTDISLVGGRCVLKSDGMTSRIPLLISSDVPRRFPGLHPAATADMSVDAVKRILKATSDKVSQIGVEVADGKVVLTAEDEEGYGDVMTLDGDDVVAEGAAKAYYPLANLRNGVNAIPRGTPVTVSLTTDYPMLIAWDGDDWSARFMIAPRINEE